MNKIIIIGDIHGRDIWKQIINIENDWDKVIFIGDYLDSYDIPGMKQLENLMDIIEFKKQNLDKVVLLLGNHDHQYQKFSQNEIYSGYQAGIASQFQFKLDEYKHLFKIAHQEGQYLFSHAGISEEWCNDSFENWNIEDIVKRVNELYHYQPFHFNIQPGESHCGQETYQGPLWIRPKSLMAANKKSELKKRFIQIVGHTSYKTIDMGKATGGRYYFIDTLENDRGEYLIIENNTPKKAFIKNNLN